MEQVDNDIRSSLQPILEDMKSKWTEDMRPDLLLNTEWGC